MDTQKTLYRDTDNKMLGGVASGLAEYMGWDVTFGFCILPFCRARFPLSLYHSVAYHSFQV